MSDQVSIVVHRRLPDGTWPPGEEPPRYRTLLAMVRVGADGCAYQMRGFTRSNGFEADGDRTYSHCSILAWADVTDVFAGGREAKP